MNRRHREDIKRLERELTEAKVGELLILMSAFRLSVETPKSKQLCPISIKVGNLEEPIRTQKKNTKTTLNAGKRE